MSTKAKACTTWADGDDVNDANEDGLDGLDGLSVAQLEREYDAYMLTAPDRAAC